MGNVFQLPPADFCRWFFKNSSKISIGIPLENQLNSIYWLYLIGLNSFQQRDFQEPDFSSGFDFDYTDDYSTEIDYETEDSLDDGLLTSFNNNNNNNQQQDFTPDFEIEAIPTTTELPLFQPTGSEILY